MSRLARIVVPGLPHHVRQSGNRGITIFSDEADYTFYLTSLAHFATRYRVSVWAYVLLPEHVHLILVPQAKDSLGKVLRETHTAYARYFNRRMGVRGHLWRGRFDSCVVDETHLWAAVRYVERNVIRRQITDCPEAYPWSSARGHAGGQGDSLLAAEFPPRGVVLDWVEWLRETNAADDEMIRRHTRTGRPCGTPAFTKKLERLLGRSMAAKKRGRKPGSKNKPR